MYRQQRLNRQGEQQHARRCDDTILIRVDSDQWEYSAIDKSNRTCSVIHSIWKEKKRRVRYVFEEKINKQTSRVATVDVIADALRDRFDNQNK